MQVEALDTTVVNYINEIKANYEQRITDYEQRITELRTYHDQQIIEFKNKAIEYEMKYLEYKEKYDLLVYKRFMRSAEQLLDDGKQQFLFSGEAEPEGLPEEEEKEEKTEVKSYTRKKPGRKPINPNIPREEKIIDIPESEKICACGAKLTRIGEEISEKLEIIPARAIVIKIIRPKYACRNCEGTEDEDKPPVRIAPVEPTMIPRSIATPSLLATIFTQKFEDHLPYNRQEKQFERIGVDLSKQDMSNWQQRVFEKLSPLFDLMKTAVKSGPVLQEDETSVQVMSGKKIKKEDKELQKDEERKPDIHTGWMWVARGGPPDKKVIWYEYHESRGKEYIKGFLSGYSGYLQTDGWEAYDSVVKGNPDIIHVGCFAHSRRRFFEASKASKTPQSAEEGIKYIRRLYELEDTLRSANINEEEFVKKRKAGAEPILEQFKSWLLKRANEISPTSLLGTAVTYTLKQWDKMTAYLGNYHLTPDNNACENAIRPFVLGRKNWMIAGSPEGVKSSCGIYSLIETAKQNKKDPFKYLLTLFEKAPLASSPEDWEKLLPWNIENL